LRCSRTRALVREAWGFLVWPPSDGTKLPVYSDVEKSWGAMTAELWQSSDRVALLKKIEADNCGKTVAPFAVVSEQGSWAACVMEDNVVSAFTLGDAAPEREELRGHTNPIGLVYSVKLIAFDRNKEIRFITTGGQLAGGRNGFLIWDLQQHNPSSEPVLTIEGGDQPVLVLARSNSVFVCSGCAATVQIIAL